MQINRRQSEVAAAAVTGGLALMFGTLAILHRCGVARAPSIAVSSALAVVSGLGSIGLACHARRLAGRAVEGPIRPEEKERARSELEDSLFNISRDDLETEANQHIQHFNLQKGRGRSFWKELADALFGRAMQGHDQMDRQMRAVGVFRELHDRYEAKGPYGGETLPPGSPKLDREAHSAQSDSSTEE
jgi:hypothetical protein